jgi:signal recognition particle receptor subunit beta
MPIYDPSEQRMVIRVVYDGAAHAGKTTNLRQLCVLFATQQKREVVTPAELRGRTLYFDWLQITAGVACGIPLLSQVLSVPGQGALAPRRRHLLSTADVVVFVCDSSEIEKSRAGLAIYSEIEKERGWPLPLVLQANKQDQKSAFDGKSLAKRLGLKDVPVIEAIASEGIGVVDTFIQSVRSVVRAVENRDSPIPVERAKTAGEVLARLGEAALDPEWAAEMLLEEAQAALLYDDAIAEVEDDATLRAVAAAAAQELQRAADPRFIDDEIPVDVKSPVPVLPSHLVPTGFVWPAHTGRSVLRALELPARSTSTFDASGTLAHVVAGHTLTTSIRACFPDAEGARQSLVRIARLHTQIGELLAPETVLVAQQTDEGTCWIWTVRPNMPAITSIASYVTALVEAIGVSIQHGITLSLAPDAFGLQSGKVRYIGELAFEPPTPEAIEAALARAAAAVPDAAVFYTALEAELARNRVGIRVPRLSEVR